MGRYEEVLAEHAAVEAALAEPGVFGDYARVRRLRRARWILEPLVRLGALREDLGAARELGWDAEIARLTAEVAALERAVAEWDPRDCYDAIVRLDGDPADVGRLAREYAADARRRGWRTQDLEAGLPGAPGRRIMAFTAGEDGPGSWAVLKRDRDVRNGVTVLPDAGAGATLPGGPQDWLIGTFCRRVPNAPTVLRITHLPTGVSAWASGPDPRAVKLAAVRLVMAELAGRGEFSDSAECTFRPGL
ncbi:hypothetical protein [Actinomadura macrotermitis]|uniref:PCRF domain-containing protein n=1 Tax=Actinomadura macrotermitis TaxID=2585200 RepID=A0A7K0C7M7_9ACTN|nr:hypothetical protein [Actinomadura macrotermitis]MQY09457.1 hypothetical protein [Actinomadura macrotermitis]